MSPNNFSNFETFTNDAASWAVLTDGARQVNSGDGLFNSPGRFAWPELPRGTPGPGPMSSPSPSPQPPAPSPSPSPQPQPTAPIPLATCGTCNSLPCAGGNGCDKCNLPQSLGGCKCDSNCDCQSGTCWA
eukprot:gene4290-14400_t